MAVAALAAVVALLGWLTVRHPSPTRTDVLRVALLFSLLVPYLLPHMHERYFFAADVLAVLYAVAVPRRWWVPVAVTTASLLSYLPYLFATPSAVPFPALSLVMGAALLAVLHDVLTAPPAGPVAPAAPVPEPVPDPVPEHAPAAAEPA